MNIYKILYIFVLCCVIYEGVAWLGRRSSRSSRSSSSSSRSSSGSSSSPSRSSSRRSSNGNSRSNSNSGGSGWWGSRRNSQSNPSNPSRTSKPKPNTPKPQDSGNKGSGWWWGSRRNSQSKPSNPSPTSKPRPNPSTPKTRGSSGWWSGNSKSESKSSASESKSNTDTYKVIERFEGMSTKAYDAQPKNKDIHDTTIGIGFNMNRPDAKKTFEKVVHDRVFEKVKSGEQTITEDQARALLIHDIDNIYEPRAKRLVGENVYDKLPSNVQIALVNAVYRGDLSKETAELMKEGKWEEAGKKYLDHYQYKNADGLGIPGVIPRMDYNKEQFDTMIKPEKTNSN